jgi:hypothetical protein
MTACVQRLGCLDSILSEEGKMKTMDDQPSRGTNVDVITCESKSKMTDVSERI